MLASESGQVYQGTSLLSLFLGTIREASLASQSLVNSAFHLHAEDRRKIPAHQGEPAQICVYKYARHLGRSLLRNSAAQSRPDIEPDSNIHFHQLFVPLCHCQVSTILVRMHR